METSQQMGGKKGGRETVNAPLPVLGGGEDLRKQLWRNNFLAIHQWAHVDPIDKLLITKSIAMNFHSCQTEGLPGEPSPWDLVLTLRTPSPSPSSRPPSLLSLPPSRPDLSVWKRSLTVSVFIFQPWTKHGRAGRWPGPALIRAGRVLPPQKEPVNSGVPRRPSEQTRPITPWYSFHST